MHQDNIHSLSQKTLIFFMGAMFKLYLGVEAVMPGWNPKPVHLPGIQFICLNSFFTESNFALIP